MIAALCDGDNAVKWRAVEVMGAVVARMAEKDIETARNVMRRLMWSLNDESGGIGWGAPETMAEIAARNLRIAREFAHVIVSYAREDGNYLEYEPLQRGLMWAIGRLAGAWPELVEGAEIYVAPFLESPDPAVRGQAARTLGIMKAGDYLEPLGRLVGDEKEFNLYAGGKITTLTVGESAREAVASIERL